MFPSLGCRHCRGGGWSCWCSPVLSKLGGGQALPECAQLCIPGGEALGWVLTRPGWCRRGGGQAQGTRWEHTSHEPSRSACAAWSMPILLGAPQGL